eukprot:TRINITY_DN13949_c0_g1_i2.p1 TRINITY_DN13949_c0_g1~~TRINITY_DN13949_c0_g1_i2.p1  ORF type:complete len:513 (+),score=68.48 TRINITY_DN13949_c0_g1_i2:50-1588(+)
MAGYFGELKPRLRSRLVQMNLIVPALFFYWGFPCDKMYGGTLFRLSCAGFFLGNLAGSLLSESPRAAVAFRAGMISNLIASWIVSAWWCFGPIQWICLMILEHSFQMIGVILLCGSRWQVHVIFTFVGSLAAYMSSGDTESADLDCNQDCWVKQALFTVASLVAGMLLVGILNFDALRRKIEALWYVISAPTETFQEDALQAVLQKTAVDMLEGAPHSRTPSSGPSSGSSKSEPGIANPETEIEGLHLIRMVGSGSFGTVHQARYQDADVAVKTINWQANNCKHSKLPEFEAQLGQTLKHTNLVRTIYYRSVISSSSVTTFIVQEWCDMGTLSEFCHDGRAISEATDIFYEICSGGAYLHSKGIVHGDLTSRNVMICSSSCPKGYECKICDFGMSRVLKDDAQYLFTSQLGTVSFMPPELFSLDREMQKLSKKVDVYSAGMLLFQICTGEAPFAKLTAPQIIVRVSKGDSPALPENVPQKCQELFNACVSINPKKRPDFDDLLRLLGAAEAA